MDERTSIAKLPRTPFIGHSEVLLEYLLSRVEINANPLILEIGCGPQSPLVGMLRRLIPGFRLHQIDARPDVIAAAKRHTPEAVVEQAFANKLTSLSDRSIDLVVAMSVFDQNPISMMPPIAKELSRVLKDDGVAIYIHNEELNALATFASYYRRHQSSYLIPSPSWAPANDIEFCLSAKHLLDAAIARSPSSTRKLQEYIATLIPPEKADPSAKITVSLADLLTPAGMQEIRREVAQLATASQLPLKDVSTPDLLRTHLQNLFGPATGFQVMDAGMFETRKWIPWQTFLSAKPSERHFVRGIGRFGFVSQGYPQANLNYRQDLNALSQPEGDDEILCVACQFGLIAHKNRPPGPFAFGKS